MKKIQSLLYCLALAAAFIFTACAPTYVHVGPNWDSIHKLKPSEKTFKVAAYGQNSVRLGERVKFSVTSAKSGRLWVVRVDPNDEIGLLFPNDVSGTNWIDAGKTVSVPPAGESWDILADRPLGLSTVAFIVTDPDTDLSDVLGGSNATMAKAISFVKTRPSWGITHIVVDVQ